MKSILKKFWMIAIVLILSLTCGISANAATLKQKAMKAYADYMVKQPKKDEYGNNKKFGLAYVNNDSIPELINGYSGGYGINAIHVLTYKNGKIKKLPNQFEGEDYGFCYYLKKGVYRITGGTLFPFYDYYELKNGTAHLVLSYNGEYEETYFYNYYKYVNGKQIKVSKKTFQTLLKQYVGSTKYTQCKYYNNTPENRKKYLGYYGSIPASIKLNKNSGNIYVGSSVQLKATVVGKSKKVTWTSSNKTIATVNSNGKVTGKKPGTTTITAKANGKTAKFKVTVKRK